MLNRLTIAILLVLVLVARPDGLGQQSKGSTSKEAAAVRAVLDSQVEAWNKRDLEGFMKGYWNSDQLSFYSGGSKTNGWQATIDRYRRTYQSEGREMGTLDFSELQIETLSERSAFVRGHWHLKMKTGDI